MAKLNLKKKWCSKNDEREIEIEKKICLKLVWKIKKNLQLSVIEEWTKMLIACI